MIATLHTTKFIPESTFAGFNYPRYIAALPRGSMADRLASPAPVSGRGTMARGFYLGDDSQPFTRWEWCDDVDDRIQHSGWFADPDGDGDKVRGIVVRLPHGRGFLAGWAMGEGMAGTVYREIYPDAIDAARAADSVAEDVASESCDTYDWPPLDPEDLEALDHD